MAAEHGSARLQIGAATPDGPPDAARPGCRSARQRRIAGERRAAPRRQPALSHAGDFCLTPKQFIDKL
jgi:hypothetical protein